MTMGYGMSRSFLLFFSSSKVSQGNLYYHPNPDGYCKGHSDEKKYEPILEIMLARDLPSHQGKFQCVWPSDV